MRACEWAGTIAHQIAFFVLSPPANQSPSSFHRPNNQQRRLIDNMGGDTSREKRKLKRLQATGSSDAAESPKPAAETKNAPSKPSVTSNDAANAKTSPGQTNSAVLRLRRKLERKAAGKFKLASVEKTPSQTEHKQPRSQQKRKSAEGDNSSSKRPRKNESNRPNGNRKSPAAKKAPPKKTPPKKKKTDNIKKKPKHLNRKMAQLSQSLADGGGNIAELEAQMKQLKEQIEVMKSMKGTVAKTGHEKPIAAEETKSKDNGDDNKNESPSSSSDSEESSSTPKENVPKQTTTKNKSDASSSSGSSSGDDSSDEEAVEENTRSRGKRRRGRREKSVVVEKAEDNVNMDESVEAKTEDNEADLAEENKTPSKKTSKKDDTRHCIGRKPVTDYSVGQKYSGKVKYIKSTMGAFIDVGSHSDAFCHISCISDGYAKTVEEVVNVGDEVEVRVVEVNREKKRLTVSLRSDEMAEIELEKLQAKTQKKAPRSDKKTGHTRFDSGNKKSGHTRFDNNGSGEQVSVEKKNTAHHSSTLDSSAQSRAAPSNGVKTGADLKRERKLARRAERRAQAMAAE